MPLPYRAVALLLSASACRPSQPERAQQTGQQTVAPAATAAQDTFGGTTARLSRPAPTRSPLGGWLLRAVRTESHSGYDRIVFEFAGDSVPGYSIEYATRPAVRCGSGDPVTVTGHGQLVVRFAPARAHDDQGNSTLAPPQRAMLPRLPAVKELQLLCDFEGQVEWVLGVATAARAPYRVTEAAPQLMLDVRHGP